MSDVVGEWASTSGEPELDPPESDRSRSPVTGWPWWTAPLAIVGALVVAATGGLIVDLVALAFGVEVSGSHTPAGLTIAGTFVQDLAFVLVPVYCARIGGRVSRSWQFGLRAPGVGWRSAAGMIVLLLVGFIVFSVAWAEVFEPGKDKVLESLGTKEGNALLVLSAALTCVVAPIGEEFLFRGYIFTALRSWRGTIPAALLTGLLFGGVHVGSAPLGDLLPLAALGFGLCLLYRHTGSLYPGIVSHCLNNCIAFAGLASLSLGEAAVLLAGALGSLWLLARVLSRLGLVGAATGFSSPAS
jgi:membrane protease YdiL (CAAX protease family)